MHALLITVFLLSWSLTWCVRRYALAKQILDIPNDRSSHHTPTPRGGGVAFVLVFMMTTYCLMYAGIIHLPSGILLISLAGLIALLGFCDDKYTLPAYWRFIGHFVVSLLVVIVLGGLPKIQFYGWTLHPGYVADAFAVLYLVWMLNLYNFMDGIDGLASIEAIFVCLAVSILYYFNGYPQYMIIPLILATAVTGFLYWNFPPARIFMGDAGSGFLGFMLGVLSLQATAVGSRFFWSWFILLGVFIVDATVTLFCRLIQGERIYTAHCNHAYQHAARVLQSHRSVTLSVLGFNILWLWPLAMLVGLGYLNGFNGVIIGYTPLCILAIQLRAGRKTHHICS